MNLIINGQELPYPKDFKLSPVPRVVAEIEVMTGDTIGDIDGFKYADTTLTWDSLYSEDFDALVTACSSPTFNITCLAPTNEQITIPAILRKFDPTKTLVTFAEDGRFVYQNMSIELSFPKKYEY